jgi:hypothetical protein
VNRRKAMELTGATLGSFYVSGITGKGSDAAEGQRPAEIPAKEVPLENNRRELWIWIPLIGFEKHDPDKGALRFVKQRGGKPDAVSLFLFHPDIVHQHDGMARNRPLPPDNCSYYGNVTNGERERQDWTSYDLRDLVTALHAQGTKAYLGIMGVVLNDAHHREWAVHEHPEVRNVTANGYGSLHIFKRFRDGTFYEDFFSDKLCQALTDYGFDGVHAADNFWGGLCEFSVDIFGQFIEYRGIEAPGELAVASDMPKDLELRAQWLWNGHWTEWIEFHAWRLEEFWTKVNRKLHALGKKSFVLEMYCTDPFETLFRKGSDLKRLQRAGVDYHMANPAATGLDLEGLPSDYHQNVSMIGLTRAFVPDAKILSMLGVRDCTEEWDTLHHVPCRLERDIIMHQLYTLETPQGPARSLTGLLVCLGDGIHAEEWKWLNERFAVGDQKNIAKTISAKVVWSDAEFYAMPGEYLRTLRWPASRWFYRICDRGTLLSSLVRTDDLDGADGTLFAPNFDLMSGEEKKKLAGYRKGAVVATAAKGFEPGAFGIALEFTLEDRFSSFSMILFAWNTGAFDKKAVAALADKDDGTVNIKPGEVTPLYLRNRLLVDTLPYAKVTDGFLDACGTLLRDVGNPPIECDLPMSIAMTGSGSYRIGILNPKDNRYSFATVEAALPVKDVKILSKYPVLPVKFQIPGTSKSRFLAQGNDGTLKVFKARIAPGGMSVFEVSLA